MALADHVVVMNKGRIEDQGSPERVYGRPATRFTATFMGESTILDATLEDGGQITTALGRFPCTSTLIDPAAYVAVRPEHVRQGPGVEAIVTDVVYQGSFKRVTAAPCAHPDLRLLARLPADADVEENSKISLEIDPGHIIPLRG